MSYRTDNLPKARDVDADVAIPNVVWSAWTQTGLARQLRRALTPGERRVLERRRDELAPAIDGYGPADLDRIALALMDMFGSFTSMRQTEEEAVARIDSVRRVLVKFPAWAIEKACRDIHINGVFRNGKFDRAWPPNDGEIIETIRREMRYYADRYNSAVALLAATVE